MDLKKATTLASVTVMTFMLAGGYFIKVSCDTKNKIIYHGNIMPDISNDVVFRDI